MKVWKKVGVIDSQDALIGNPAYDLVSLIDDVRLNISLKDKKKIFDEYLKINIVNNIVIIHGELASRYSEIKS